jgi:rubrerythrin
MNARTHGFRFGIVAVLLGSYISVGCVTQPNGASPGALGCGERCGQQCTSACPLPPGTSIALDQASQDALRAALQDERNAQAFYTNVIARHGQVRPFINIVRAEGRHEAMVLGVMERHGVADPKLAPGPLPEVPATISECAARAAKLERDNIALYDRLLTTVKEEDVRVVFQRLRSASLENHLPAFERWAS